MTNLLLDTHAAIWAVRRLIYLPDQIRMMLEDADNTVTISIVTLWEIAIKRALGRKGAPPFSAAEAHEQFKYAGFQMLPVKPEHTFAAEALPLIHGDPFDRMLVAQAITEPLHLLTHDAMLAGYTDQVIFF